MQQVQEGYKGLGLLIDVNNDRLLTVLAIAVAMAVVGLIGVEYAHSFIVQDHVSASIAIL